MLTIGDFAQITHLSRKTLRSVPADPKFVTRRKREPAHRPGTVHPEMHATERNAMHGGGRTLVPSGLLLLADSRTPSGGHGHSGGVESLVDRGLIRTVPDLAAFLEGRLATGGRVPAAAAAAACALASRPAIGWEAWDAAVSARVPSAALRRASRAQGAALLRTVALAWPGPVVDALRSLPSVHHLLVLGAATAAAGAAPEDAAGLALHHMVGGACSAAVRLLGLDPLAVAAVAVAAGRSAERVAAVAATDAALAVLADDPALLPSDGSPLHDVLAQLHDTSEATLFAS